LIGRLKAVDTGTGVRRLEIGMRGRGEAIESKWCLVRVLSSLMKFFFKGPKKPKSQGWRRLEQ